jgi:outer membrane receptor protein involved in Fe transport
VSAQGFRTYRQGGIDLTVGRMPTLDVKLEVGAVAETVEVTGEAPVVDVTQSKVATTVQHEVLDNLPKGRSFQTLIPFAPGARTEPLQGGTGKGFQIDGASDGENVYMVDGVNITNIQNGGVGKDFQTDFIQEVQVKTSSFEAEFGGALGGVINVVPQKGSNAWHGSLITYLRSNAFNANDSDRTLRINPATSTNTATRLDGTPEYYMGIKDQQTIVEPGYTVGGPLWKNKLWVFSSYIPSISTTRRFTNFTGANAGPRTLTQTRTDQNAYNRLDYGVTNSLRVFGSWNYGYYRQTGSLPTNPDSVIGQRDTSATTDPNTLRADGGSVNPLSIYSFGGDWTPTARLVVSARYGYYFSNTEQRGTPVGLRYTYSSTANAATSTLDGSAVPTAFQQPSGYQNIPSNLATAFDSYKRKSFNGDASYFVNFAGTHTFKGGYFWQGQSDEVLKNFNGGAVSITWGQSWIPQTSATACDQIIAQNKAQYGASANGCQGKYGYFIVGTNVVNTGSDHQSAKALYFQDQWQVSRHLTLNLGLRFDTETQPPFDPNRFPTVHFGWGDKLGPRLGGAYDLLHNGKLKVYASYGVFYDIMKLGLARGSFGSDYWHNCYYALDDPDPSHITPTYPIGGGCPASGPAPGVNARFIENVDLRATKADPRDPAISPDMKPMKQHEFVTGFDWEVKRDWSLSFRYSRKRLDNTIEDMSITDNLGFYIGNPGSQFADILHRPVSLPCPSGTSCSGTDKDGNYLTSVPFCAECPPVVPAIRRYDGAEFRLARRPGGKWFGSVSYTYSRLTGNYPGLTNTDPTDGGTTGRHAPNNSRLFDLPTMTYLPSGKIDDGPLPTDRPHTATGLIYYRLPWKVGDHKMETNLGISQYAFQGTPIDSCIAVTSTGSACQWAAGRGNFLKLTRNADGSIAVGDVVQDARTDPFVQTDVNFRHEIPFAERYRLSFEGNILNIFNQRATTVNYENILAAGSVSPSRAARFPGDPGFDWGKVMNGYNLSDALNGTGAFAGATKLTLASRYGMPLSFQTARTIRLSVRFTF